MITVQPYQPSDYDYLVMLHETNETSLLETLDTLPQIGYIATEGCIPVSAGFLRRMEGGFAQIDTLVTNKDLDSRMRHEGISLVVSTLLDRAKAEGVKGILSITTSQDIVDRAKSIGFHELNHKVIGIMLSNGPK